MQALAMFSSIVHGGEIDLTVDAAVPGLAHRFSVNNKNSLVLQKIKVLCLSYYSFAIEVFLL